MLMVVGSAYGQRNGGPVVYNPKVQFAIDPPDDIAEDGEPSPDWPPVVPLHGTVQAACFTHAAGICAIHLFVENFQKLEWSFGFDYATLKNGTADRKVVAGDLKPWKVTAAQKPVCPGKTDRAVVEFNRDPFKTKDTVNETQSYHLIVHVHRCVYERESSQTRFVESAYDFAFSEAQPGSEATAELANHWNDQGE